MTILRQRPVAGPAACVGKGPFQNSKGRTPRPTRNVWNDSFRSMLTLLDGEAQPEQDVVRGKFLV